MNAKISVIVICVEVIIYLSLYNMHDFDHVVLISLVIHLSQTPKWNKLMYVICEPKQQESQTSSGLAIGLESG